jgi:hypothetical protein
VNHGASEFLPVTVLAGSLPYRRPAPEFRRLSARRDSEMIMTILMAGHHCQWQPDSATVSDAEFFNVHCQW